MVIKDAYLVGKGLLVLVFVGGIGGCADTPHADSAYAEAYRQMVVDQTLNNDKASHSVGDPPASSDAQRLAKALEIYRTDVGKGTSEVKQTLQFEVGKK